VANEELIVSGETTPPRLSPGERALFSAVIRGLRKRGVPFVLAGGFGFSHYSGFWRNTKDMDVLVTPADFTAAAEVVLTCGFEDYFDVLPYDRSWIFRAHQGHVIVDIIDGFANHVDVVEESWFARSTPGEFAGEPVRYLSPEDLIWTKLFVFQRDRCDWTDLLNIIRGLEGSLDWNFLLRRVGEHWRLLAALVDVYDWLCPAERGFIPDSLREELARRRRRPEDSTPMRADLLDSRHWLTEPGAGLSVSELDSAAPARGDSGRQHDELEDGDLVLTPAPHS
jgi:hypothetical protein